jgi:hypothetical protein
MALRDTGHFLPGAGHVHERASRTRTPFTATAPASSGTGATAPTVTKNFRDRTSAERWLQDRRIATLLGWTYARTDTLTSDPTATPTPDETGALERLLTDSTDDPDDAR